MKTLFAFALIFISSIAHAEKCSVNFDNSIVRTDESVPYSQSIPVNNQISYEIMKRVDSLAKLEVETVVAYDTNVSPQEKLNCKTALIKTGNLTTATQSVCSTNTKQSLVIKCSVNDAPLK